MYIMYYIYYTREVYTIIILDFVRIRIENRSLSMSSAALAILRRYASLVMRIPQLVRRLFYNRTAAILFGSLLYTIRGTLWVALLRGKWLSWVWSFLRQRRQLQQFENAIFKDRVQAAIYVPKEDGRVAKRTLFEDSLVSVLYGNTPAATSMRRATQRCTQQRPFLTQHLRLTHPLLNAVLNRLSSLSAVEHIKAESMAELPDDMEPIWFVFAVVGYSPSEGFRVGNQPEDKNALDSSGDKTFKDRVQAAIYVPKEDGRVAIIDRRSSKVRVFVVREDRLKSMSEEPAGSKQNNTSSERHAFRRSILLHMKSLYNQQFEDEAGLQTRHLLRVQMGYRYTKKVSSKSRITVSSLLRQSPQSKSRGQSHSVKGTSSNEDGTPKMFTPRRRYR